MTAKQPAHPRQLWLAWLCALCLLGAQGLGHWHRIAHGGSQLLGQGSAQKVAAADGWGHQGGSADCHLFDQLSHDQALSGAAMPACAAIQHLGPVAAVPADAAAASRWKRGARGPPLFA